MLLHHDGRPYAQAAGDAAQRTREKFEALIATGRNRALAVIDKVQREVPCDRIVKATALDFEPNDDGIYVHIGDQAREHIHPHALGQLAERAGIPNRYVNDLLGLRDADENEVAVDQWGARLLAHNFKELFQHCKDRFLTRSVDGQIRGVMSDKYRRLDTRPILEAFVGAVQQLGALPIEGHALDTKVALKAILPRIYEPVLNEPLLFGVHFGNSDFGDGAVTLRGFCLRLFCTNYATTEETLRKVHLGGRLDDSIEFSQETYRLDTKATASAVQDMVGHVLQLEHLDAFQNRVKAANERGLDAKAAVAELRKKVGVDASKQIVDAFNSPDIENLPAGNTEWRWSNAISWVAGQQDNEAKRLELEQLAGDVLKAA